MHALTTSTPPPSTLDWLWSIILANGPLEAIVAFIIIGSALVAATRYTQGWRNRGRIDIRRAEGDNIGITFIARPIRLHKPMVTINGNPRLLRAVGATGRAGLEYMERNVPYEVVPFPFRLELSGMRTPMWVRVDILDESSNRAGAEVHIANGKKGGLVASPVQGVFPPFELTFDADELKHSERHEYFFWPYIKESRRDNPPLPPSIVSVTFVEKTRTYPYWKRVRKMLGTKRFGMRGLRVL